MKKYSICLALLLMSFGALLAPSNAWAAIKFTPQVIQDIGYPTDPDGKVTVTENSIGLLVQAVYKYLLGIVGVLTTLVIMYGGVLYITAAGNSAKTDNAKQWIFASLTGLILALSSYTLLYMVNPDLLALRPITITVPDASNFSKTSDEMVKFFKASGIDVKDGVNLGGLQKSIIDEVLALKTITDASGGHITITSGLEGEHANVLCGHANGCKADLRLESKLNNSIENNPQNFEYVGVRNGTDKMYQRIGGGCYVREDDHWDVAPHACP